MGTTAFQCLVIKAWSSTNDPNYYFSSFYDDWKNLNCAKIDFFGQKDEWRA
jgi:hypothetical protein